MSKKKLLYITHLSGRTINRFWISSIVAAQKAGYEFHLACNMAGAEKDSWEAGCKQYKITTHQVDFDRNPFSLQNVRAKKQLLELMKREKFEIVHCNTPIGGVLGRLCAKKAGIPNVIYQAHGFHFLKGGPMKSWILYYPVERYLSRITDVLITINREDYKLAQTFKQRKGGRVEFVPGIGVDTSSIRLDEQQQNELKNKLGLKNERILVSVGELNKNKNHKIAIEALAESNLNNYRYLICGEGGERADLETLCENLGISNCVLFLGYRQDVKEILSVSDVFIFPSYREGLSAALMEAMAAGMPCIASRIRGNVDLLYKSSLLFDPNNKEELISCLKKIDDQKLLENESKQNSERIHDFSFEVVTQKLMEIYRSM